MESSSSAAGARESGIGTQASHRGNYRGAKGAEGAKGAGAEGATGAKGAAGTVSTAPFAPSALLAPAPFAPLAPSAPLALLPSIPACSAARAIDSSSSAPGTRRIGNRNAGGREWGPPSAGSSCGRAIEWRPPSPETPDPSRPDAPGPRPAGRLQREAGSPGGSSRDHGARTLPGLAFGRCSGPHATGASPGRGSTRRDPFARRAPSPRTKS